MTEKDYPLSSDNLKTLNEKASLIFELANKGIKVGVILAFISLIMYLKKHDIPMPISLASLPTLLMAIFAISLMMVVFVVFLMLIPLIFREDNVWRLIFKKPTISWCRNLVFNRIWVFVFINVVPFFLYFGGTALENYYLLCSSLLLHISLINCFIPRNESNEWRTSETIIIFAFSFFTIFWTSILVYLTMKALSSLDAANQLPTWLGYILIICFIFVFFTLLFLLTVESENRKRKTLKEYGVLFFGISLIFWAILLNPVFSSFSFTESALRVMNIGGGIENVLLLNKDEKINVPDELLDNQVKYQSVDIMIMLDVGTHLYVKIKDSPNCGTFEIPVKIVSTRQMFGGNKSKEKNQQPIEHSCEKVKDKINALNIH